MDSYAESSGVGRARSRLVGGRSSSTRIPSPIFDPIGELSGFPLVQCPDCGLARVVEGRTKKDSENHGRLYFKCARNGFPKLCRYYRFEKQYFQHLKDLGVIVVRPSNWAQLEDEEGSVDSPNGNGDKHSKELEVKMEKLIWKFNMFFVCVVSVAVGCVLMYAAMK